VREDVLPRRVAGQLANALAGVAEQEPATVAVDRDELRQKGRCERDETLEDRRLVRERRRVRLEEEVTVAGRDAQHGRPRPHVRLLDRRRRLDLCTDPGVRLLEPGRVGPHLDHAVATGRRAKPSAPRRVTRRWLHENNSRAAARRRS
jgi:hypothetical protein